MVQTAVTDAIWFALERVSQRATEPQVLIWSSDEYPDAVVNHPLIDVVGINSPRLDPEEPLPKRYQVVFLSGHMDRDQGSRIQHCVKASGVRWFQGCRAETEKLDQLLEQVFAVNGGSGSHPDDDVSGPDRREAGAAGPPGSSPNGNPTDLKAWVAVHGNFADDATNRGEANRLQPLALEAGFPASEVAHVRRIYKAIRVARSSPKPPTTRRGRGRGKRISPRGAVKAFINTYGWFPPDGTVAAEGRRLYALAQSMGELPITTESSITQAYRVAKQLWETSGDPPRRPNAPISPTDDGGSTPESGTPLTAPSDLTPREEIDKVRAEIDEAQATIDALRTRVTELESQLDESPPQP